jgi:hypothetical protein
MTNTTQEALARPSVNAAPLGGAEQAALLALMEEECLEVDLAAAKLGHSPTAVQRQISQDPVLADRVTMARAKGTIKILDMLRGLAEKGDFRAVQLLLTSRDARFVQRVNLVVTEEMIRGSPHWKGLVEQLLGALAPGHTCTACGGCQCRERIEALR